MFKHGPSSILHVFVVAEALVGNHGLQTAQSLLQEEVLHAEEHSEVRTRVSFSSHRSQGWGTSAAALLAFLLFLCF